MVKPILDLKPGRGITKGAKRIQLRNASLDVQPYGPLAQLTYEVDDCIIQWCMTPAEVGALRRVLAPFDPEGKRVKP